MVGATDLENAKRRTAMIVGPSEELLKIKRDEYFAEEKHNTAKIVNLRDQFAMAALTGMLACHTVDGSVEALCRAAYDYADAMMEERNAK